MDTVCIAESNKYPYTRFLTIWAGQLISNIGSGMTAFALGVYVFKQTGTATGFSFVMLALFLPAILLRPVGGLLADRWERRWMIILGDTGSAASVLFLLFSLLSGPAALWKIYLGVALNSAFTSLQAPAYKASVSDLVPEDRYEKAAGLLQLSSSAQHLFSPVLAGLLLTTGTLRLILLIDISSFLFAVTAALSIPSFSHSRDESDSSCSGSGSRQFIAELRGGWEAVASNPEVRVVVMLISLLTLFVGVLQTLFAPMMLGLTEAGTLGIAQSAGAVGMLCSSLLLGIFGLKKRPWESLLAGIAVAGFSMSLMGLTPQVFSISAAFFLFFCTLPVINTGADVLIRRRIPNRSQGRAWGIIGVLSQFGYIIAYGSSGLLADRVFGPLLSERGLLSGSLGRIIGTGPGRGIALMLLLSGICVIAVAAFTSRTRKTLAME